MLTKRLIQFAAPVALVMVLATACGSDTTTSSDVPSLNGTKSSGSVTTTTVDAEEAVQKFVACLREQGLDVADPKVGSDGQIDMRSVFEGADIQPGSEEFTKVQDKCGSLLANAGFGPSDDDREARQESMLAFTTCLRKEGLDVGDMTFGGPGGPGGPGGAGAPPDSAASGDGAAPTGPTRGGGAATEEERNAFLAERLGVDASDPAVTAAFTACSDELSAITAGGPGGPGGPGGATTTTEG